MSLPFAMGRVLVGAPENTPLRVLHMGFDLVRLVCDEYGVHEGDEVTCLANRPGHLLLELSAHRRVLLERNLSSYIEVEPLASTGQQRRANH